MATFDSIGGQWPQPSLTPKEWTQDRQKLEPTRTTSPSWSQCRPKTQHLEPQLTKIASRIRNLTKRLLPPNMKPKCSPRRPNLESKCARDPQPGAKAHPKTPPPGADLLHNSTQLATKKRTRQVFFAGRRESQSVRGEADHFVSCSTTDYGDVGLAGRSNGACNRAATDCSDANHDNITSNKKCQLRVMRFIARYSSRITETSTSLHVFFATRGFLSYFAFGPGLVVSATVV